MKNSNKLRKTLSALCLSSFLTLCSCGITIHNTTTCTAAGHLANGAICAESLTGKTSELTFSEFIDFLEAGENKGSAMCQSAEDYAHIKDSLEKLCRMLGPRCSYEVKETIRSMKALLEVQTERATSKE